MNSFDKVLHKLEPKTVSIIVPIFTKVTTIAQFIRLLTKSLKKTEYGYEIIFLDCFSEQSDKTYEQLIAQFQARLPIKYFRKKNRKDKFQTFFEAAKYALHDIILVIEPNLQYPPESIPQLLSKIEHGDDVVVANRQFMNGLYQYFVGKLLHKLDVDFESEMIVFRKEITHRISLEPLSESMELEFLVKAREAGYSISGVDIPFNSHTEKPVSQSYVQGFISSISLKLLPKQIVPFHQEKKERVGEGFTYKHVDFVHFSNLNIKESAIKTLLGHQAVLIIILLLTFLLGLLTNWQQTLTIFVGLATIMYFTDLIFNFILIQRTFKKAPAITVSPAEINQIKDWPAYTIFCPLYREWTVVPQFIEAIEKLDYPKDKLQVQLLLEEDDQETIAHVKLYQLPKYFQIIIVPDTLPKTKPKACNYGLKLAIGEYAVIYDAEDMPDPLQLKKAVLAFRKSKETVACIQAKLNYYNTEQNLLTRLFTAEYTLWFDLILTGLQSLNAPIPLGGTSNHFKVDKLREVKGWDSFNVTEDCDLGIRLAKKGYSTAILDSITLEEANSQFFNWINQRSRWIKGYIQTYLVHMRDPSQLLKKNIRLHFFTFQLVVGGKIMSLFINPIMWITTISYILLRSYIGPTIEQMFPMLILYLAVFSLIAGNFLYMYYYMIACAKRQQFDLIKYVYLVPFYWIIMSFAAWKGLIQLISNPHYWPKTKHGLHLPHSPATKPADLITQSKEQYNRTMLFPHTFKIRYPSGSFGQTLRIWQQNIWQDLVDVFHFHSKIAEKNTSNLKILIFNWRDKEHAYSGGAEVYIHELAKRWVQQGHKVTLFCGNDGHDKRYEEIDGVEIVRRGGFYFVYIWALLYYLLKFRGKYDVIVDCQNGIPFFTPLYVKEKKLCLMFHVHQEVFYTTLSKPAAIFASFLENKLMPLIYRRIKFITISQSTKKDMEKLGLGIAGIDIVHPGVDISLYATGEKSAHPFILYVGRLKKYKSVDIFIRVAKKVLTTNPAAEFVIAGNGEEMYNLKRLAEKLDVFDKIKFLGTVTEEQKLQLYKKAWIFVNPSFMEGWGITNIEANACGTPVVASNVPGIRDSVKNPHSGLLVEHGNVTQFSEAIISLIEDSTKRSELSQNARVWSSQFDWDKSAQESIKIIKGDH